MPTCHALCQALGKQYRVSYSSCESVSPSLAEAYRLPKQKLHETMRQTILEQKMCGLAWASMERLGLCLMTLGMEKRWLSLWIGKKKMCLLRKSDTEAVWSVSWYCFCREISYDHLPFVHDSDLYRRRYYREERASAQSSVLEGLPSM